MRGNPIRDALRESASLDATRQVTRLNTRVASRAFSDRRNRPWTSGSDVDAVQSTSGQAATSRLAAFFFGERHRPNADVTDPGPRSRGGAASIGMICEEKPQRGIAIASAPARHAWPANLQDRSGRLSRHVQVLT